MRKRRTEDLSDRSIPRIRHTVAVKMLQAGRPLVDVSQLPGHSTIRITRRIHARFMPERFAMRRGHLTSQGSMTLQARRKKAAIRYRYGEFQQAGWWVVRDSNPRHLRC